MAVMFFRDAIYFSDVEVYYFVPQIKKSVSAQRIRLQCFFFFFFFFFFPSFVLKSQIKINTHGSRNESTGSGICGR